MSIATLLELAKISPYLVLPALFMVVLWKIYKENNKFTKEIIDQKTKQFDSISESMKLMSELLQNKLVTTEKENREQLEKHNENTQSRLESLAEKIESVRWDIVKALSGRES